MASRSREISMDQHISGLTVTGGARLFAGTNTTNNIYNGPVNLRHPATKDQILSYYEIPNRRVDGFVGREDILQKIDEALSDGSGPHYAVLQGMGGQGKSQVAMEYCHRKKDRPYSAIFWVDATTESSVKGSFQSISECIRAEADYLPNIDARVAFVLRMFTSWTVQWLMVFDNYDNPDTFLNIRDFIPPSERGAILFTSRHPDSKALVISRSTHIFELSGLEESAAVKLLVQQSQTNEVIPSDAKKVVERLGCHPLAITQAGAYIRKRKLRLCEFMDHYKRRKKMILESTPQLSHYRKRLGNAEEETSLNVFTTWELSFQQIQSEASENDVEAKLLTLLAFFDKKDISEQLFAGFNAKQEQLSESTKLLIWLNAFRSVEGQWNSELFEDVLIRLKDASLLQSFARGLDGFYHASLHPLVKDWIHLRTDKSISQENTYMAGTLVADILQNSWQKEHFHLPLLTKQNITSHIIALEDSYQELLTPQPCITSKQKIFDEYITSQFWFARFLLKTGSYYLSEIINQRLNTHNQKVLGLEHPNTLTSMACLESTFWKQGRWKEAEELDVQVMETRKSVLGLEHPDTLTSMANLAATYQYQGRLKEAEELEVQVMETKKRMLGLEHPDTLNSMANLAWIYRNQGRLKEAEELEVQVKEKSSTISALRQPRLSDNSSSYGGSTLVGSANLMQIEQVTYQFSSDSGIEYKEQVKELESDSNDMPDSGQLDEIQSIISDDEDISSQISSENSSQRDIAERELGDLMAHHPELNMVYDEAMALMPADRFVANFRRLLKRFYLDIRPIASTRLEHTAVGLLRSRGARMRLARIVSDTRKPSSGGIDAQTEEHTRGPHRKNRTELESWLNSTALVSNEAGQNSKESGEPIEGENIAIESGFSDPESDDKGEFSGKESSEQFPNIRLVEDFLTRSVAFQALSHNFAILVLPPSLSQLALSIPPSQIRFSNENDISLLNKTKTFMEELTGAPWNWWPLSPRQKLLGPNQTRMHWQCVRLSSQSTCRANRE